MAGFIGEDQVRRVKEATDLVHLMGEYSTLRRAGQNHVCCCPFHQERSPSCHVYDDGHYHCYGCGAHGDPVTLVREKEHLEFTEAIEYLARRAGIELTYEKGGGPSMSRSERDVLIEAFNMAVAFYENVLWNTPPGAEAREYLASRGLSQDICRRFRLGWAPGSGALIDEGRKRRIDVAVLAKLDLAVDRNGRWGDRFFERVTFPIADRFGNPIAISARLLPAAERRAKEEGRGVGKYVNNTDTPLFHKSDVVFNLHQARPAAKEAKRLIVMEGPTDVMAAADAGIKECVAVLGTALTAEHAKQLGTIVGDQGRLLLVFDGDTAGQTNSLKAVKTCLSVGVPCWVAVVPDGLDPGELLKEEANAGGRERFERTVAAALADVDHLCRALAPRPYELEHRERLAIADQVLEVLRPLEDRELRDLYVRDLARWLGFDQRQLERRVAGASSASSGARPQTGLADLPKEIDVILHVLVREPGLRDLAFDTLGFEPSQIPAAWRPLAELLLSNPDIDGEGLRYAAEQEPLLALKSVIQRWLTTPCADDPQALLRASFAHLRLAALDQEARRVTTALAEAARNGNHEQVQRLNQEQFAIARQRTDALRPEPL